MKTTIVGGGVNGLCSAYYLQKQGCEITVIDSSFDLGGTSHGNAGMIVPSHFIPMASPGVISKGIKWMFDSSSPFYIKPRLDLNLIPWLWRFYRSCNMANVERYQELIWQYNELSKAEYSKISSSENFAFDYQERGLLMLYKNTKSQKEEVEVGKKAEKLGLNVQFLDRNGVQNLNPETKVNVEGGVFYPGDAQLYSNQFMKQMKAYLIKNGVNFITKKVTGGLVENRVVKALKLDDSTDLDVSNVVLTAGAWTGKILRKLGIKLLIEDGRGYSITSFNEKNRPFVPSILTDEKVAITPMGDDLRITGTLEISGLSKKVNHKRVKGFLEAVPNYFPQINIDFPKEESEIWTGYRPLSPDGLPYVGRSSKIENLVVATGHGMMGMSLGPGTGKIVSEILTDQKSELDRDLMKLDR